MKREKPKIISMVKINGEWVTQEDVDPEVFAGIVETVIRRAAANIGFDVTVTDTKEKLA